MQSVSVVVIFALSALAVAVSIEIGFRIGRAWHRRSEEEKESPVSSIVSTTLGLLAFILGFTFAIVSGRYDARIGLVRDEAGIVRTAYERADFLPPEDQPRAKALLKEYLDVRLQFVRAGKVEETATFLGETERIQRRLWDMAVANARRDMNSDVAALYIESLNEIAVVHAARVSVGIQARIPPVLWVFLFALIVLAMFGVGYQTAIAGSRRTWAMVVLALAFSLVIALITELDRPGSGMLRVTQQPLTDARAWMTVRDAGG